MYTCFARTLVPLIKNLINNDLMNDSKNEKEWRGGGGGIRKSESIKEAE